MGKNKKVKRNGFSEFMFEFIANERRYGRTYNRDKFSEVAAPHWEKLSSNQKDVYQKRARDRDNDCSSNKHTPPKYTSHGILISEMEAAQAEYAERQRQAIARITKMTNDSYLSGELAKTTLHFIMANYFVETNSGVFYPAELCLIKFTFGDGLLNIFHQYLNPQTLPTGYAFDAIDRAKVHRLKVPPHAMGETCFDKVYEDMLGFLKENYTPQFDENSRELPMAIFTHDIHMKMIKSILSQLPQRPDDVQNDVDVLSLNMLFNQLKNIDAPDANTRISIHVSNMLMDADRYDAASNIACNYHEENDGALQCAMSICRRWFYTFCDHVCAKLGVTLVSGVHLPDNSDCNRKRRGGDSKKNRSGCSRSSE